MSPALLVIAGPNDSGQATDMDHLYLATGGGGMLDAKLSW